MNEQSPVAVLVHGAFAESTSWSGVVERLLAQSIDVVTAPNQLRSLPGDAAYVRDVIAGLGRPVVLVAHSYGGMVITEAADVREVAGASHALSVSAPDAVTAAILDALSA
jgi:pimeloyl-ACP methyl ester carboxylesterase